MSKSKARGTKAETAIVNYLQFIGFPYAERRAGNGNNDRGDIAGIPGVVIEVKSCKTMTLAAWLDEATLEAENAKAPVGVVWHKRKGTTDPGKWYVTMTGATFADLIS